jgi:RNA polymerase sigma-70 factor (ECF subfamily)
MADAPHFRLTIEEMLEHSDWVHRLARQLLGNRESAEDVVQDAWLAALDRPPRIRSSLGGWLRSAIRHAAIRRDRSEAIRRRHETAAARTESAPAAAELVARAQGQRVVASLVLDLPEPYRSTLLLRYFEGRSFAEIARDSGTPESTVRVHHLRALKELRERLLAREKGDPDAWRAVSALLSAAGVPTKSATLGAAGAIIMTVKTKAGLIALGCLLLAGGTWWKLQERGTPAAGIGTSPPGAPAPPAPSSADRALSVETRILPRPLQAAAPSERAPTPAASRQTPPPDPGMGRLEVPILEADGRPARSRLFDFVFTTGVKTEKELADEDVWISGTLGSQTSGIQRFKYTALEGRLGEDDVAVVDVPADAPGHLRLREAPAGQKHAFLAGPIKWIAVLPFAAMSSGEVKRLDPVRLTGVPLLVAGRIETDDGQAVRGAVIQVRPASVGPGDIALNTAIQGLGGRSGPDGTYRVESVLTPKEWLAFAYVEGTLASAVVPFEKGRTDLVIRVRGMGAIKGRARTAPNLPDSEPQLTLEPEDVELPLGAFTGRWSPRTYLQVKKTGDFSRDGIPAGTYQLVAKIGIARVLTIEHVIIRPGQTNEDPRFADLVLGDQLRLAVIRVVDADGRPVPHATVYWAPSDQTGSVRGGNTSTTGPSGETRLPLPEDTLMNIRVEARGARPWQRDRVTLPLVVTLDGGARVSVGLPGSSQWARPEGIMDYLVCLIPEADVDAALKDGRNPIPSRLHRAQVQMLRQASERYTFEGAESGRFVVFVVPRRLPNPGKSISAGEWQLIYGDRGLEIGRLDLEPGANPDITYRVDVDKLMTLALRDAPETR